MFIRKSLGRTIDDWPTLMAKQQLFDETGDEWVFRGHSHEGWSLTTSLERSVEEFALAQTMTPDLEVKLILEFVRHYHLYTREQPPRPGDTLDWLALMRHHGAPTRLLDFTFSFPIAAYFALEDRPNENSGNPTVWAVNKSWLTRLAWKWAEDTHQLDTFRVFATLRDGAAFRQLFLESEPKFVAPVSPFRRNQRLRIQNGIFLCPGNVQCPFEKILKNLDGYNAGVLGVPIAAGQKGLELRSELLKRLGQAGLDRASLFPGLDGFAQALRTRLPLFSHLQKLEKSGARNKTNVSLDALKHW
jgi:hypothetical protein